MPVMVLNNQSVFDLAIQYFGSVEGCFAIADKLGISVTDAPAPGEMLELPSAQVINSDITGYYAANGLTPACGAGVYRVFDETFALDFD